MLLLAAPADAQSRDCDPRRQICLEGTGRFREQFHGASPVRVSGNLLVGVSLAGEGAFQPGDVRVSLPEAPATGRLCLGVASRDGRYFAENLYRFQARHDAPLPFYFPTEYLKEIREYRRDDVAVLIRDTERCDSATLGTILPGIETSGRPDRLRVFLNAPAARARVSLLVGDMEVAPMQGCAADRDRNSLAFSAICTITLPSTPISGQPVLLIQVRERMDTAVTRVPLRLGLP